MDSFLKADIFFFITSVAVILVTVVLLVLLYYVIRVMQNVRYISDKVREETDMIAHDIHAFRSNVKEHGFRLQYLLNLVKNRFMARAKGRTKRSRAHAESEGED
jgi:hypothetical protein